MQCVGKFDSRHFPLLVLLKTHLSLPATVHHYIYKITLNETVAGKQTCTGNQTYTLLVLLKTD
jgi:hypothetical protein